MEYIVKTKMVNYFEFRVEAPNPLEAQSRASSMMNETAVPTKVEYLMTILPIELAHEEL